MNRREYMRNWMREKKRKDPAYAERQREASRRWKREHPVARQEYEKRKYAEGSLRARRILQRAVMKGHVIKPKKCENCGVVTELHGHHSDYTRPLDVIWLCKGCHSKKHHDNGLVESGGEKESRRQESA